MFNKLKNKKVNFFGKSVSVFVIAMIAFAGLGSAALVAYLSNSITGSVVVDQLLTLEVSTTGFEGFTTGSIRWEDIHGGESVELYTRLTNNGAKKVNATGVEIKVSGPTDNVDCEEFTVNVYDLSGPKLGCTENIDGTVSLTTEKIVLSGDTYQDVKFVITANIAIEPGSYTFTAAIPSRDATVE